MKQLAVLLPTYNSVHYLQCSIDSLLAQSFVDFDLYIYDDCSTDGTEAYVKSINDSRVIYKRNNENLGIAKTLNKGLQETSGNYNYIARMDADDWSYNDRFKKQIEFLETNLNIGMCGTQGYWVKSIDDLPNTPWTYPISHEAIKINLLFAASFGHSSVMFRAKSLPISMEYGSNIRTCEDWDLWVRLIDKIEMANLPDFLMQYRIVEDSNHRNEEHKLLHLKERSKIISSHWEKFGYTMNADEVYKYYYGSFKGKPSNFIKALRKLLIIFNDFNSRNLANLNTDSQVYFRYKFLRFVLDFWKRSDVSKMSFGVWLILLKEVHFAKTYSIIKNIIR